MNEMAKLATLLTNAGVPFEVCDHWCGTKQICYPSCANKVCDAVCFPGSYGYEEGLLEIMCLVDEDEVGDTVEGHLTAVAVFQRIYDHYEKLIGCKKMNVNSVNLNDMSLLTDTDIIELINSLNLELNKRDAAKRDEAIAAFQRAYYDLKALGITPAYQEDGDEYGINLRDWDCFYF